MSDPQDELMARFETDSNDQTSDNDGGSESSETESESSSIKDEKTHVAFYVPEDLAAEYDHLYKQFNAKATLSGGDEIEKNQDFNTGAIEFILENQEAFQEFLQIEDPV